MKHIIITLMLASVVMASDEQKKHDDAWKKVIEKRKQLEKANKELEKTIQEIIKKLKKINWYGNTSFNYFLRVHMCSDVHCRVVKNPENSLTKSLGGPAPRAAMSTQSYSQAVNIFLRLWLSFCAEYGLI